MHKYIFVLLLGLSAAAGAEPCELISLPDSQRLVGIQLEDGRSIYVLGYNHGNRDLPFEMSDLIKSGAKDLDDRAFDQGLRKMARDVATAADEESVDFEQLRELLTAQPELEFVGFETEDRYAKSNLENYKSMLADFRQLVQLRDPQAMPVEQDLERVVLGAAGMLSLSHPELMNPRGLRGFESAEASEASRLSTLASEAALLRLNDLAKEDREFLRNVIGTGIQLDQMYREYSPSMDASILNQVAQAAMPEAFRPALTEWVRLKLAEMAADKRREHDVVENLMAARASGILIMGDEHMDGIMAALEATCHGGRLAQASIR